MPNINGAHDSNNVTQFGALPPEKAKKQKDMTFQDMYNHEEDYDDSDDDDSDWEPLQKHVASTQWVCTNCTMSNLDDVLNCDLCGEHKDSEIISYGTFVSQIVQAVDHTQVTPDADGYEDSCTRNLSSGNFTAVGFDERMLLHSEVEIKPHPHPERPDRLRAIAATLATAGIFPGRCISIPAREITQEELAKVHSLDHIEAVEFTSCMLSSYFTPDTYANEHSACAARLAAGLCADLSSAIMSGSVKNGFALVRPPGHHAGIKEAMGFCLHNNAAIAALAAQAAGAKKVLIVDWDVHHGNGTQEIFEGSKSVLYVSLHRHEGGKFYPGTGAAKEVGSLGAEGYCVNVPWNCGGVGDNDYIYAFQHIVLPIALAFAPDLTIVSAGFDAARGDPLGCCDVTPAGYAWMTHMLMPLSSGKLLVILEGGYNLRSISTSATAVVKVLLGEGPDVEMDGVVPSKAGLRTIIEVLKIQKKFWPDLKADLARLQSQCASSQEKRWGRIIQSIEKDPVTVKESEFEGDCPVDTSKLRKNYNVDVIEFEVPRTSKPVKAQIVQFDEELRTKQGKNFSIRMIRSDRFKNAAGDAAEKETAVVEMAARGEGSLRQFKQATTSVTPFVSRRRILSRENSMDQVASVEVRKATGLLPLNLKQGSVVIAMPATAGGKEKIVLEQVEEGIREKRNEGSPITIGPVGQEEVEQMNVDVEQNTRNKKSERARISVTSPPAKKRTVQEYQYESGRSSASFWEIFHQTTYGFYNPKLATDLMVHLPRINDMDKINELAYQELVERFSLSWYKQSVLMQSVFSRLSNYEQTVVPEKLRIIKHLEEQLLQKQNEVENLDKEKVDIENLKKELSDVKEELSKSKEELSEAHTLYADQLQKNEELQNQLVQKDQKLEGEKVRLVDLGKMAMVMAKEMWEAAFAAEMEQLKNQVASLKGKTVRDTSREPAAPAMSRTTLPLPTQATSTVQEKTPSQTSATPSALKNVPSQIITQNPTRRSTRASSRINE